MKKLTFFLFLSFISFDLHAGVVMESTRVEKGSVTPSNETVQAEGEAVRIDSKGPDGNQTVIFRKDKQLMWMIDNDKKVYHEMTKADFEKMGSYMNDAMAQAQKEMDAQLAQMPAAQRAQVEAMMKQNMPKMPQQAVSAPTQYKKIASGEKIGAWTCDKYDLMEGQNKVATMWVADWAQLGVTRADFAAFESMADFFSKMSGMQQAMGEAQKEMKEMMAMGLPIKQSFDVSPGFEQQLVKLEKKSIDATVFDLPADYKKEAIPDMPPMQ